MPRVKRSSSTSGQWLKDWTSQAHFRRRRKEETLPCLPSLLYDIYHSSLRCRRALLLQTKQVLCTSNHSVPSLIYSCTPVLCNPQAGRCFQSWETASLSCPRFLFPLNEYRVSAAGHEQESIAPLESSYGGGPAPVPGSVRTSIWVIAVHGLVEGHGKRIRNCLI